MNKKFHPKKLLAIAFLGLFCGMQAQAQAPQKFNYQGIARDLKGNPIGKQQLGLKISVLPTEDATQPEYEETQLVSTNEFGLYTLQIGNGTPLTGKMETVKWETGNKYIRVAIDPAGGQNYTDAGTTQLLSVPYAIYADKAGIAKQTVDGTSSHGGTRASNNYIEKTSATGVANSNSLLYDNGTNIGLNTTSPAASFHVYKNSAVVQEHLRMQNASTTGAGRFTMYNDGASAYATFTKYGSAYAGGYTGVTTLYPYANLLAFGNNGLASGDGLGRFLISTAGNAGISLFKGGTSKLKFHADFTSENVGIGGNSAPVARVHLNNTDGTTMNALLTNNTTGHTATDGLEIKNTGNAASIINRENDILSFGTNNLERARIDANGNMGINTTTPSSKLHVTDATSSFTNGIIRGEYTGTPIASDVVGVFGQSLALTNWGIGVKGVGNYRGVEGISGSAYGVYGSSTSFIGVTGVSDSYFGVRGTSNTGVGVYGLSTKNYGVYGTSDSLAAGYFTASNTASGAFYNGVLVGDYTGIASSDFVGVYGRNTGNSGFGIGTAGDGGWIGVRGTSPYYGVAGVITGGGLGDAVNGNGGTYGNGLYGYAYNGNGVETYTTNGNGVSTFSQFGIGVASVTDSNSAGYFTAGTASQSAALNSDGVLHGEYTGTYPADVSGVMGISTPPSSVYGIGVTGMGNWIGVRGIATGTNYAGYFDGNLYATNASSSIKAFRIDHPLDPSNKYLYHSSVESNDMMNLYNGNITTDANGEAWVTLPSYFEALNKDFKYQLTVIGTFAQAIIADEIQNNQFRIKTNVPNVKVSWQVSGVRKDAMAEAHRIVNEVEKSGREAGLYQNPIEHGRPASDGIFYQANETTGQNNHSLIREQAMKKHDQFQKRIHLGEPSKPLELKPEIR